MHSDLAYRNTQTYSTLWIRLRITSGVSFPVLMRSAGQQSQVGLLIVAQSLGTPEPQRLQGFAEARRDRELR